MTAIANAPAPSHAEGAERTCDSGNADWPADWPNSWFEDQHTCLFCGSAALAAEVEDVRDWFFRSAPGSFTYLRCGDCGTLVLGKRPVAEKLGLAYSSYYTHEAESGKREASLVRRLWQAISRGFVRNRFGGSTRAGDRLCAALLALLPSRRLGIMAHYRFLPGAPTRLLDYGCGNGDFLLRAQELGHHVVGIDFDEGAVAFAASRGLDVRTPDQAAAEDFSGAFGMITANHVLEHVPDPRALLRQLHGWLTPGGRIYLEMPNAQAGGIARFGKFWRGFEAPRHFAIPSRKALRAALEEAGFANITFHDRWSITPGMDAQSAAATRRHARGEAGSPGDSALNDCEFLTVTAERR